MVQYYWGMWVKRSEMLAPLTDLVGECDKTKTTKKNKTKTKPWPWDMIHQHAFDDFNSLSAKSILAGEKLIATDSIST